MVKTYYPLLMGLFHRRRVRRIEAQHTPWGEKVHNTVTVQREGSQVQVNLKCLFPIHFHINMIELWNENRNIPKGYYKEKQICYVQTKFSFRAPEDWSTHPTITLLGKFISKFISKKCMTLSGNLSMFHHSGSAHAFWISQVSFTVLCNIWTNIFFISIKRRDPFEYFHSGRFALFHRHSGEMKAITKSSYITCFCIIRWEWSPNEVTS